MQNHNDNTIKTSDRVLYQRVRVKVWGYYVEVLREFSKRFGRKRQALFKLGQWHFH